MPVFGVGVVGYCPVNVSMPRVASDEIRVRDVEASVCLRSVRGQRPLISARRERARESKRAGASGYQLFEHAVLETEKLHVLSDTRT